MTMARRAILVQQYARWECHAAVATIVTGSSSFLHISVKGFLGCIASKLHRRTILLTLLKELQNYTKHRNCNPIREDGSYQGELR